jgi:Sulfotransferase domain
VEHKNTSADRVKVLFIGGYSRSGSTLLDCMLGQLPGVFSTGELAYIWTHGLQENRLCGCGSRFRECSFWAQVGELAFGGWDRVDPAQMIAFERAVNRHRLLPFLLMPSLRRGFRADLERYTDVLARLYGAIQRVSGARLIVDSTIDPAYGFLLSRADKLDLRLVHMVRDSRATAFSWTRKQKVRDRVGAVTYQRRFHPAATAVRWSLYHLAVHLLSRTASPELHVLYERVVASPEAEIRRVMRHIEEPLGVEELDFLRPGEVTLDTNHTVAGSRMRLTRGPLAVRIDDEWASALEPSHRRLVTALTWPFLRGYGYLGRASRAVAGGGSG